MLTNFVTRGEELAAHGPDWIRALRRQGRERFEHLGLPTPRIEEWRATNLAALAATDFVPPDGDVAVGSELPLPAVAQVDLGGPRLVFVDGRFVPRLSSYGDERDGLWVGSLADALLAVPERVRPQLMRRGPADVSALEALNLALHEDGAVVLAEANANDAPPVHLVFIANGGEKPTATHPKTLVAAGPGSRLQVVETYVGSQDAIYLTNAVTHLSAQDNAHIDHYRLQLEGPRAFHISNVHSHQTRDSRCTLHQIDLGGRLVRHDVVSVLDGEGADCHLNGLHLTDADQHVDNHTLIDHAKPNAASRELYKGILAGGSRAVFNGRIVVRKDAQKTDARQSNANLLLSEGALARSRPQLEIYADDVKCSHGATVGLLDEDAVFYLRSRGFGEQDARNLMIAAFAGEILDRIEIEALRSELERVVAVRLPRDGERRSA